MVRDAFDVSVACTPPSGPPVSHHSSQLSTVPNANAASASTPPSWSSHSSLVAEKYGSKTSPVRLRIIGSCPAARSSSHRAAVRRSCHTMARWRGWPVRRSQTTVVSRWFVIPIAATACPAASAAAAASANVARVASRMSSGSCSTQPGRGKCWGNSR